MNSYYKKFFVLGCVSTMIFVSTGCDLFSSPKKTTKKINVETAAPEAAPVKPAAEAEGPLPANVVVRVGSWKLTESDFKERLKLLKQGLPDFNDTDPQTKATVLNELIRQELLVKDAESSDIGNKKDITEAVEDFRRTLLVQELANRITKNVTATEAEAQKYYDQNKNLFIRWTVRQISVPDEATAKSILVQVLQGGDFSAIAKEQSKDKLASNGGLIPDVAQASVEAQKAIVSLDAGATSSVFKGPEGYSIVHVDEKKLETFTVVKKELISGLTLRKQQNAILEYIDKLAQKTKVEVNKELLGLTDKKQP